MRSLDVANYLIANWSDQLDLTNLKLNKLVYYAQVIALRKYGEPLFEDPIQAWEYGPVEPAVYREFKQYGSRSVPAPHGKVIEDARLSAVADELRQTYGKLMTFDLVRLSHREGGAWEKTYEEGKNNVITPQMIRDSVDFTAEVPWKHTFTWGVQEVDRRWPNALRMLENS
ncbi:Panacea domain-containing protein [Bifidobacterium canis]|uniref:Antitoxin SocA-like Panacea domain-containing protein n=1 Tax=Bifidobacterium canis TaxID=2610880 RepID=A0A7K1J4S1_9BIFI|nr:type II toxin-antitoxin system antitoxin SocA domain-containing protein [Bifidobacterium canis]MUH59582.1 hypothetical protein [Bifidobacterium canis]